MHKLGISVYPDLRPLDEIKEYLALAGKYGVTRLFSSMFQLEGSREEVLAYFRELIQEAHKYGMEVSLDVNPEFLEQIGVTPDDVSVFHEIGCDIIRMDGDYKDERDIMLINNPYGIKIEFNTSMVEDNIKKLIEQGADPQRMVTCHNFYPQPYTGMEWKKFLRINENIKKDSDVVIAAFVSSNEPKTHGVWDAEYGLPTVERMRHYPIDLQARLLLASDNVDDILVGNAYASEDEFKALAKVVEPVPVPENIPFNNLLNREKLAHPKAVKVKLHPEITDLEKDVLLNFPIHVDFGDSSEWIWRSRMPRVAYKGQDFPIRDPQKDVFERGDVILVNDGYKHYAGEIQIVLEPMKNDGLRNLIGTIEGGELDMLDLIKDGDVVRFLEQE